MKAPTPQELEDFIKSHNLVIQPQDSPIGEIHALVSGDIDRNCPYESMMELYCIRHYNEASKAKVRTSTATSKVLADLKRGEIIGTDNFTASRYGTNKIPDVIYKLRRKGHVIETMTKTVRHRGITKKVAEYRLVGE